MRPSLLLWTAIALVAVAAGLTAGFLTGRPLTAPVVRTVHAGGRPSRLGRTAAPSTPSSTPSPTPSGGATTTTVTVRVGGLSRTYQLIQPVLPLAARLPALVVLHGVNSSVDHEEQRDGLLPLATAGQAVLVYPAGYGESWNAGVCCPPASTDGVDDVGFLDAVVQQVAAQPVVDPARIAMLGFSNGGRMAYQFDCALPGVAPAIISVLAVPVTPCDASAPVSMLAIATADDPEVPYASGTGGDMGLTAVTDVVAAWRSRDGCADTVSTQTTAGSAVAAMWSGCASGTQVELATYATGGHAWQEGDVTTPSMQRVIWSFAVAQPGLEDPLPQ